jgi:hypothetical protein
MGMLAARAICTIRSRAKRASVADFRRSLVESAGEPGCGSYDGEGSASSVFQGLRKDSIGSLSVRTIWREVLDLLLRVGLLLEEPARGGDAPRLGECMVPGVIASVGYPGTAVATGRRV